MASAVDSRLAYARLSAVATASRLPTATRGSNNSYTTSWDTTDRFIADTYLPDHNRRFATPPELEDSAFVPLEHPGQIDDICRRTDRTVARDNTVRYERRVLQIPATPARHHYVKATVRVHEYPDGTLALFHGPRCLARYTANGEPIDTPTWQAA